MPTQSAGTITFVQTWWWGEVNSFAYNVHQVSDGGYVVSAAAGFSGNPMCMALVRTDSLGDTSWVRFYNHGADRTDGGYSCMTWDHGYALLGGFLSQETGYDIFVLRTDSLGDTLWSFVYAGPGLDNGVAIIPTFDRGLAITGHISDANRWACGLMKLDSTGHMTWLRIYEVPGYPDAKGYSVQQMPDSGFVIAGHVSDTTQHPWLYLVRTDPQGETLWSRVYDPKLELSFGLSVCVTRDSGFAITGIGNDPDTSQARDATFLLKTDWKGDTLWLRRYHGSTVGNLDAYCVRQTADLGFVLAGDNSASRSRPWLQRTDSLGDSLWARVFEGLAPGCAYDVQQTRDGGYVVSALANDYYACLVKTDSLGLVSSVTENPAAGPIRPALTAWPNPFSDRVSFELPIAQAMTATLQILDVGGRLVRTLPAKARTTWDATNNEGLPVPNGVYMARLRPDSSATVQKLLLVR
jgi:hypothetical protein